MAAEEGLTPSDAKRARAYRIGLGSLNTSWKSEFLMHFGAEFAIVPVSPESRVERKRGTDSRVAGTRWR